MRGTLAHDDLPAIGRDLCGLWGDVTMDCACQLLPVWVGGHGHTPAGTFAAIPSNPQLPTMWLLFSETRHINRCPTRTSS